ncbi:MULTISPECIES: MFS transporter [Metallosphaera]|uniref:Major facilitator superfamily MFS_1 n=3 Tax=Metallosphaera TaxID=41980 RepID=A4YDD0_METS5|nr:MULTISPECIES: MFS transporter [Metallosphaera]ABP94432.1 major facilitator superfamily MFS_1 [Metallosphaera sedula DSM 5348]AIM26419.1 major facilitator superfamily MFS_1 [Metallosphaera sedula]AKV73421.1 MFS transporter [Metallosphaera sedula]AKV75664.1 MFS transporter [Metallosphaera sedula]AKV77910.1 MFS transporter [Metallosphaera sedula]
MKPYLHATLASTIAWAGNIYDLLIITYVYQYIESTFHIGYVMVSLLFSFGLLGRVVGGTLFGRFSDKYGRKPVLIFTTLGYSLSHGIMAFSPNVIVLFLARLFEGVFMGGEWTAGTVIAYESAPVSVRGILTGIVQSGYGMGYALTGAMYIYFSPLISEDWRIFLATGTFPLLLVPYMKLKVPESKPTRVSKVKVEYRDYLNLILKSTLAMSGMFVAYFSVFGNYPTFAEKLIGISPSTLGLTLLISNVGLAISFIVFGRLADRINVRKLILSALVTLTVSLFFTVPGFINLGPLASIISTMVYASSCGFWPLIPLLLAHSVPVEVRGLLSGMSYNIGGLVGGIAEVITGIAMQYMGILGMAKIIDIINLVALITVFISVITWPRAAIHTSSHNV